MTTDFTYNYHDSNLDKFEIGPRRELNLTLYLDTIINGRTDRVVNLSFRAIENVEEVNKFFKDNFTTRPAPNAFLARIDQLKKTDNTNYLIEFDHFGQLIIKCKGHVETEIVG